MVDFTVPEQSRLLIDGLLQFLRAEVDPLEASLGETASDPHQRYDETGRYRPALLDAVRTVRTRSAAAGYYGAFVPEAVGGGGLDFVTYFLAWEALYHRAGPGRPLPIWALAHWATGPNTIHRHLDPAVRAQYLPSLLAGETSSCFALSEPDAGSDAWAIRTRAVRDGDNWRISGTKQWITNSPYADVGIVFTVTDPARSAKREGGVTAFFFDTHQPGFHVDSVIRLFGHAGGEEAIISFDDYVVPDSQRLGPVDEGFPLALEGVNFGRVYNGARSVGLGRWALEQATDYARQRVAFGKPIGEQQMVQAMLADSAIDLYAARSMGIDCAWRIDTQGRAVKETSMMKAFATEACFRVFDRAIQVFGGMGMTNETRLYDGLHTARTIRIADGSAEILRRTIARELLKGNLGV